jgi:hypothetical protein
MPTAKNGLKYAIKQANKQIAKEGMKQAAKIVKATGKKVTKGVDPKRIYSARELKRRADNPQKNNAPNPNHNFPESFNKDIFGGTKTKISDNYTLYSKKGNLNGRPGTYEIGVKPSVSGKIETITHRFFKPGKVRK